MNGGLNLLQDGDDALNTIQVQILVDPVMMVHNGIRFVDEMVTALAQILSSMFVASLSKGIFSQISLRIALLALWKK